MIYVHKARLGEVRLGKAWQGLNSKKLSRK